MDKKQGVYLFHGNISQCEHTMLSENNRVELKAVYDLNFYPKHSPHRATNL